MMRNIVTISIKKIIQKINISIYNLYVNRKEEFTLANAEAKKQISVLQEIDKSLDESYDTLREEIEAMQIRIAIADREAERKMRKKLKKNPNMVVSNRKKISIRNQILNEMEETNFLDRVAEAIKIVTPAIVIISRLVAALIQVILSVEGIRRHMSSNMLQKLQHVYEICVGLRFA